MSAADPMTTTRRTLIYLRDRNEVTPRQARRLRHKENVSVSARVADGLGRYGRLKRRYEKRDNRDVRKRGIAVVGLVRQMRSRRG